MRFISTCAILAWQILARTTGAQDVIATNQVNGCVPEDQVNEAIDYFPSKYEPPEIYTYDTDVDIFGEKFVPHNTTDLLEITYHNTYKIVTNHHNNVSYLLYQCGTQPPQEEIDSGNYHLVLPVPHTGGIAVTQTPQIPYLELLGLRQEIVGYIGDPSLISSPCMQHMLTTNPNGTRQIEVVWNEEDPWNSTTNAMMRADFLERHPNVIILAGPTSGPPFGPRQMNVAATQERTNVAAFDWIAIYGALWNREAMSNRISRETQERYDCTSTNARLIAERTRNRKKQRRQLQERPQDLDVPSRFRSAARQLQAAVNHTQPPVILWANYFTGLNWSIAECPRWDSTYYCEYATHCGTTIISRPPDMGYFQQYGGPTKYWYVNDDEFLQLGKDADIFIFPSSRWDAVYESKKDVLDQLKAVQNQQVYDTQGSGPNSWFEQRYAEYDVVGLDMCELVGTTNPNGPAHERRWFRNIFTEPIGSFPECRVPEELSEPFVPRGAECELLTEDAFPPEEQVNQEAEPVTEGEGEMEPEEDATTESKPEGGGEREAASNEGTPSTSASGGSACGSFFASVSLLLVVTANAFFCTLV